MSRIDELSRDYLLYSVPLTCRSKQSFTSGKQKGNKKANGVEGNRLILQGAIGLPVYRDLIT